MNPDNLTTELDRLGRRLAAWRAVSRVTLGAGVALAVLALAASLDVSVQLGRAGRVAASGLWLTLAAAGAAAAWFALARRRTAQGTAALVERAFPALDNRLINAVQFARADDRDPFKAACLREGVPGWEAVKPAALRNRRAERVGWGLLGAMALAVFAPAGLGCRSWGVAVRRVANPFSDLQPLSLTRIVAVEPGDSSVPQGAPLDLRCKVAGRRGHRVWLDLKPADDKETAFDLGPLAGGGEEEFAHRLPAVTTALAYRFRAGDSPFPRWFRVETRVPLAFTGVRLTVEPPAYTRYQTREFDALRDAVKFPQASRVRVAARCNQPARAVSLAARDGEPVALAPVNAEANAWTGAVTVLDGAALTLAATDPHGGRAETTVAFELVPDREPELQVLEPKGRATLGPDGQPRIQFVARDDYGLAELRVERVAPGAARDAAPDVVARWEGEGKRALPVLWSPTGPRERAGGSLAYRVVARDNFPGAPHETASGTILFELATAEQAAEKQETLARQADAALAEAIERQRRNIAGTEALAGEPEKSAADAWAPLAETQRGIRDLTGELLKNPLKPLAGLTPTVERLYQGEMLEAITALDRARDAAGAERRGPAEDGLRLQRRILRQLTSAELAAGAAKTQRRVAGVLDRLDALVTGQTATLAETHDCVKTGTRVARPLADRQDALASDAAVFAQSCVTEADGQAAANKKFADLLRQVAADCESKGVKADMLKAAEHLEGGAAAAAAPLEARALANLRAFQAALNAWQGVAAQERVAQMAETLKSAGDRMEKLRKLEQRVQDTMKQIEPTQDKTDVKDDVLEEEIAELRRNTEEAMLQVARDLHIFPELSVANELVEDVFSVFEEVKQRPGSEKAGKNAASEMGVLKPEELLDAMKKAEEQIEAMEQWLADKPDAIKFNMEAFDRAETPKMALAGLQNAVEDLIGDLLKESKELGDAADDSATNLGETQNKLPGWEVAEGPSESFGAQGKSGNQAPDHKEQSGRSNVGRQGQAMGETAAGTGTVSEGDPNIEKRITPDPVQSGQVQTESDASVDQQATGGGKRESGAAKEFGMPGAGAAPRLDAPAAGSQTGLQALMAKSETLRVKTAAMNLRTESLSRAAHHIRQASDAVASGLPIRQVWEYERRAVAALKEAKTDLASRSFSALDAGDPGAPLQDAVEGATDQAPAAFRDLVSEYYKALNRGM